MVLTRRLPDDLSRQRVQYVGHLPFLYSKPWLTGSKLVPTTLKQVPIVSTARKSQSVSICGPSTVMYAVTHNPCAAEGWAIGGNIGVDSRNLRTASADAGFSVSYVSTTTEGA